MINGAPDPALLALVVNLGGDDAMFTFVDLPPLRDSDVFEIGFHVQVAAGVDLTMRRLLFAARARKRGERGTERATDALVRERLPGALRERADELEHVDRGCELITQIDALLDLRNTIVHRQGKSAGIADMLVFASANDERSDSQGIVTGETVGFLFVDAKILAAQSREIMTLFEELGPIADGWLKALRPWLKDQPR